MNKNIAIIGGAVVVAVAIGFGVQKILGSKKPAKPKAIKAAIDKDNKKK